MRVLIIAISVAGQNQDESLVNYYNLEGKVVQLISSGTTANTTTIAEPETDNKVNTSGGYEVMVKLFIGLFGLGAVIASVVVASVCIRKYQQRQKDKETESVEKESVEESSEAKAPIKPSFSIDKVLQKKNRVDVVHEEPEESGSVSEDS